MNKKIIATKSFSMVADWHCWLNKFSEKVVNKEYHKLDYHLWKDINKITLKDIIVNLVAGLNYCTSTIEIINGNIITQLNIADYSLGEFLFENIFNQEERDMLYNCLNDYNNSCYSDNATNNTALDYNDIIGYGVLDCDGIAATSCSSTAISGSILTSRHGYTIGNPNKDDSKKEKDEMKGFNFDFGPCTNEQIRMSMYGIAVKNAAGTYVSYNPKSGEIIDVDILNFDGSKFIYKIPVAIKDIAVGDIVIHNRTPMFVKALPNETTNTITCVDVSAGEEKHIIPTISPFGFNFITKVVSFFNMFNSNTPTPDAPFGNMLPFMLMSEGNDRIDPMMAMFMMNGNFNMNNPMMMYFMLKDKDKSDMLPFLFMMNK